MESGYGHIPCVGIFMSTVVANTIIILILRDTASLAAETPLSVLEHRW